MKVGIYACLISYACLCEFTMPYYTCLISYSCLCKFTMPWFASLTSYACLCKFTMLSYASPTCYACLLWYVRFIMYVVPSSLFLSFMRYDEYISDRMTLGRGFWVKLKNTWKYKIGNLPIKLGLPLGNLPIKLGLPKYLLNL